MQSAAMQMGWQDHRGIAPNHWRTSTQRFVTGVATAIQKHSDNATAARNEPERLLYYFVVPESLDSYRAALFDAGFGLQSNHEFNPQADLRNNVERLSYFQPSDTARALSPRVCKVGLAGAGITIEPTRGAEAPLEAPHRLASLVDASRKSADIDDDAQSIADEAVSEAKAFVLREGLAGHPSISLSSDGILTLHWKLRDYGVALIFAGDGNVSLASNGRDRYYAESTDEISIDDALPQNYADLIAKLSV